MPREGNFSTPFRLLAHDKISRLDKMTTEVPIDVIDAKIHGMRLNSPTNLEATALRKAIDNALTVSVAKGFTTFGGLSHELYAENFNRRLHVDSIFRLVCCLYADCLQQEIPLHILAADNGLAMYHAEQKGSLLEYYLQYPQPARAKKDN